MTFYITILILSVLLHEFGHLFASLFFNVKVKAFSFGFGKILLHKKWNGIDWRISLLPLGGYCDIEEGLTTKNSLACIPYWKQVIILTAGVNLNLLIALVVYLIHYGSIVQGLTIDWNFLMFLINGETTINFYVPLNFNISLFYVSFLNLTLFLFNMIPFPALDGGYLWLMPLRRKMGETFYKYLISISFYFLMIAQVVLVIYWWFIK